MGLPENGRRFLYLGRLHKEKDVQTMIRAGASCLAIEAERTLLFDGSSLLRRADEAGIAIVAVPRRY